MANEILRISHDQVIFFLQYAEAPIVIGNEPQILRLPSSALPLEAAAFIPAIGQQRIDDGKASWQLFTVPRGPTETIQHLLERVKLKWTQWSDKEDARIQKWAAEIALIRWIDV